MISNVVSNCFIGNMGGHAIRYFLDYGLKGVSSVDGRAHLPCRTVRKLGITGPILGIIRNPFDWYIATYRTELQYHKWRGSFQDWFYNRDNVGQYLWPRPSRDKAKGPWLWDTFMYFAEVEEGEGPTGYTHILQYERLKRDFICAMQDIGIIPHLMDQEWVEEKFGFAIRNYDHRQWFEGVEQWMRPDMYTAEMVDDVYRQDEPIFERFGYTFEGRNYYQGGCGQSRHGTQIGNWEQEQKLSECWVEWGPERPGPFVKPSPTTSSSS